MQNEESGIGTIKIHKNVIASIASLAAVEIEGVKRIGGGIRNGIMEFIGRKTFSAIDVETLKNEEVKIRIPIIIKYGFNVPEVASKTQENVRASLEKMTNLSIKNIDINVQGIEKEQDKTLY